MFEMLAIGRNKITPQTTDTVRYGWVFLWQSRKHWAKILNITTMTHYTVPAGYDIKLR